MAPGRPDTCPEGADRCVWVRRTDVAEAEVGHLARMRERVHAERERRIRESEQDRHPLHRVPARKCRFTG